VKPGGWIRVHRAALDPNWHPPGTEPEPACSSFAWIDLVGLAAWDTTVVQASRGDVPLARGEVLLSARMCAKRWRWSKSRADRFLRALEDDFAIRKVRGTLSGTVYRVVNYDTYQNPRDATRDSGAVEAVEAPENRGTVATPATPSETPNRRDTRGTVSGTVSGTVRSPATQGETPKPWDGQRDGQRDTNSIKKKEVSSSARAREGGSPGRWVSKLVEWLDDEVAAEAVQEIAAGQADAERWARSVFYTYGPETSPKTERLRRHAKDDPVRWRRYLAASLVTYAQAKSPDEAWYDPFFLSVVTKAIQGGNREPRSARPGTEAERVYVRGGEDVTRRASRLLVGTGANAPEIVERSAPRDLETVAEITRRLGAASGL